MIIHFFLSQSLREKLRYKRSLLWILDMTVMLILTCILFTISFKFIEDVSWEEAIWQVWQTATTVGYGNRPAETSAGRWATILFGMLGIAILGTLIGTLFDYRDEVRERRRLGFLENPFRNGIVVFNYPGTSRFNELLRELRFVDPDIPICVVDNRLEELPPNISVLPNIHFLKGSILSEETYKNANLQKNWVVIIFPVDSSNPESDATTKVTVDMVEKFAGKTTRIIHILVDPKNCWLFADSKSTAVMESLEILALVQETHDPFCAPTIQRLLLNTEGGNPMTVRPTKIVGWTWGELMVHAIHVAEKKGHTINPFALIRNRKPVNCPSFDMMIEEDDLIIITVQGQLDWKWFEKELVKAKKRDSNSQKK